MNARRFKWRYCHQCGVGFRPFGTREIFCTPACCLLARVDKSGGPHACWPWTGTRQAAGYGTMKVRGKLLMAHRVTLEQAVGPIGELYACHRCDNPPCCNPAHLFAGNASTNMLDCVSKGRRKHVNYATGARHGMVRKSLNKPPAGEPR